MNTIKKFRNLFFILLGLGLVQSCVQDDEYAIPPTEIVCSDAWETTTTLHELVALIDADSDGIIKFEEDVIIEGYVISDDNPGNFFKTISFQDSPSNPTIGIQVEIDEYNLANFYPVGSRIQINLKNIYAGFDRGVYKVGETFESNGETRVGRMRSSIFRNHVKRACGDLVEIKPVVFETIAAAKASGILNTLITINNVQFTNEMLGLPFALPNVTEDKVLEDESGATIILRNSGYADFADQIVPEGSGSITVVLSTFFATHQLYIRDENDVQFNNPRFGDDGGEEPGGNSFSCLTESFTSYSVNNEAFSNYENLAVQGNRRWRVKEFDSNKYIEVSAFQTTGTIFSYFVVPVNFSEADSFSFRTKDGHNNGNALKIYYSTNYALGGNINNATLVDITSSFTLATGTTSGYGANFIESGNYNLSSLTGEGVIIFAYEGGNGVTTTFQIDDIKITDNENPNCN